MNYPLAGGYGYPPQNMGYPPQVSSYGQPPIADPGYNYAAAPGGMPMPNAGAPGYGQPSYSQPAYSQQNYYQPGYGQPAYNSPGYGQRNPYSTAEDMSMPPHTSMHGMVYAASAAVNFRTPGYSQQPETSYGGMPQPCAQPLYPNTTTSYPNTTASYPNTTASYPNTTASYPNTTASYPNTTTQPSPYPSVTTQPPQPVQLPVIPQPQTQANPSCQVPQEPPTQGTVRDHSPFDAQKDAEALRKAMKGLGTDEKTITQIVGTRSNRQRQVIKLEFATLYGKDLIKELKSELSGNYEKLVLGLFMTPEAFDAYEMYKAMEGVGTDERALIEILCTRTNVQIKAASAEFKKMYKKDLEKEIHSETSGHFKRLLVSLCQGSRSETQPLDARKATEDAHALYSAGEARWGTDESRFNVILASRSFSQLRLTFEEYRKISRKTIEQAIDSEMSGDLNDGMKAIVKCAQNRPGFLAERLYKSMKGLGTDDQTLIRIMVSRSEIDMVQIKSEFQKAYGKTLAQFIADDCSGDYKKLLLQICGN